MIAGQYIFLMNFGSEESKIELKTIKMRKREQFSVRQERITMN